ncbi:MAG: TolC family protein [Chitinophagales bacterium]|nr:TolC family protein [Chitinophagales bacterium]
MKRTIQILLILALSHSGMLAQTVYTEQQVIDLTIKNSHSINAATLATQQNRQLQKGGFNLADPSVSVDFSSDGIEEIEVSQSFEFPSVYVKQGQLRKQQTLLAEKQQAITTNDVKRLVRLLYLELQYRQALLEQLKVQDSLYNQIAISAQRQFDAGQIDFLAKTFTAAQYGDIHIRYLQALAEQQALQQQLKIYTGINDSIVVEALVMTPLSGQIQLSDIVDSTTLLSLPNIQYWMQQQTISRKSLALERNRVLPGFVVGYAYDREFLPAEHRFRAGITVPLWFWQYRGSINAARIGVKVAEEQTLAQQQAVNSQLSQAKGELSKYSQSLEYFNSIGIQQTNDIISSSQRFFESGETDYISNLRNINDAYAIKLRYLETLKGYNEAVIQINYLTGN